MHKHVKFRKKKRHTGKEGKCKPDMFSSMAPQLPLFKKIIIIMQKNSIKKIKKWSLNEKRESKSRKLGEAETLIY